MLCTCSQNYSDMCRTCDEYANNMADVDMDPGPGPSAGLGRSGPGPRSRRRGGGAPPAHALGPLATWQPGPTAPAPHPAPVGSLLDLVAAVHSRRFLTFKHRACSNYHDIFKFFVCKKRFHVCSCSLMFSMFSACSGHVHKA